jgi:superfamily II DNA or RNA helicase
MKKVPWNFQTKAVRAALMGVRKGKRVRLVSTDGNRKAITPWPFQVKAVRAAIAAVSAGKRVLLVSPGGSGKTVMAGMLTLWAAGTDKRVLLISNRREILRQTYKHLTIMGVPEHDIGLIYGDAPEEMVRPRARVQIASIQSLFQLAVLPAAEILIVDECHRVLAPGYLKLVERYKRAVHVGLTATPFRMDGVGLGNFYNHMVVAAKPSELIEAKLLAEPKIFTAMDEFQPNLRSVRIARGDYLPADLEPRVMRPEIIGGLPDHYALRARDRQGMTFALSIAHSKATDAKYRGSGIRSEHVDGAMPRRRRDRIIDEFKRGHIQMLNSCDLLTEGFDLPDCDAVLLARPTTSLGVVLQQSARAMRYNKGIRPVILDHARLFPWFGMPDADRPYTLGKGRMTPDVLHPEPVRMCQNPECGLIYRGNGDGCPECGAEYVKPPSDTGNGGGHHRTLIPAELAGELKEYSLADRLDMKARLEAYAKEQQLPEQWVNDVLAMWVGVRAA